MADGIIGAHVIAPDAPRLLAEIERAERLGIPAVWLIGNPVEPVPLLAAAAVRTERVLLGTAIIRTWPRHPIVAAEEAAAIAGLAPGRFRLGVGPASRNVEEMYGIPWVRPLAHLRAYVKVLKSLLDEGAVDLEEAGIVAHARLATPPPHVPVLASALRHRSFEVCGEMADGAITWLCPGSYVRDVALPAVRAGAARAGRPAPPLVMHVPACVHGDVAAIHQVTRERFALYVGRPHYAAMFEAAGFPEVREGQWSDAMIDAVVAYGSEATVADRLRGLLAMGVGEVMVTPLGVGDDSAAVVERTLRLVASLRAP
jgi:alkanesulfonate monooxygenase SsuD/methylene tetrahydromethanopterin reductase-like flavin-dependent oxidoreductase (luciferase family)